MDVSLSFAVNRAAELQPQEMANIVAFLKTLTGKQPQVAYPVLPPSSSQTPKPEPM